MNEHGAVNRSQSPLFQGPRLPASSSGSELSSGGRVVELDSVRALAALAVIIFHTNSTWLPFGWAAVDLFFVLSGYLITSIILRHGGSPGFLRSFYFRRGLRTWPIYYLLLLFLIVMAPVLKRPCIWSSLPHALTYTQGLTRIWQSAVDPFSPYVRHTWSLAIEEQFYLIWPALVLVAGRRRVVPLCLLCAGASVLARGQGIWWDLCSRSDGLILGGLLAALHLDERWSTQPRSACRLLSKAIRFCAVAALIFLGTMAVAGGASRRRSGPKSSGLVGAGFQPPLAGTDRRCSAKRRPQLDEFPAAAAAARPG